MTKTNLVCLYNLSFFMKDRNFSIVKKIMGYKRMLGYCINCIVCLLEIGWLIVWTGFFSRYSSRIGQCRKAAFSPNQPNSLAMLGHLVGTEWVLNGYRLVTNQALRAGLFRTA